MINEKCLTKMESNGNLLYYLRGKKIVGAFKKLSGDVSGVHGDATNISGNLDDCNILNEDRETGIDINDLIK